MQKPWEEDGPELSAGGVGQALCLSPPWTAPLSLSVHPHLRLLLLPLGEPWGHW